MIWIFHLALREERKCSARCRHIRKEKTPDLIAPENPEKIQWLTIQLNRNSSRSNLDFFFQKF